MVLTFMWIVHRLHCQIFCKSRSSQYIPTLTDLHYFKLCHLRKLKNVYSNIFQMCAKFSLGSTKARWDEGGRIILLGDNTGGKVIVPLSVRFQHGRVQNSTGLPYVNIYTWPCVHTILTRPKYDLHQTFQNVTTTSVRKCLYTYTLHSLHKTNFTVCLISGFCWKADEICTLLDYYAAYDGNFWPTFQNSAPSHL